MSRYLFRLENGVLSLPLDGCEIARCVVDQAFELQVFRADETVTLRIEGPFTLMEHGRGRLLDPSIPVELGPAIALVRGVVKRAQASETGRLSIIFDDGRELVAEPNDAFEAWELVGPHGAKAVCRAGGGVSTWGSPP